MPTFVSENELFGRNLVTEAELFGKVVVDDSKIKAGEIPNGDIALLKKPSHRKLYEDILNGDAEWDSIVPENEKPALRQLPDYEENAKRVINSAYLADLSGLEPTATYLSHDQLTKEILKEDTPGKAFDRIKDRWKNGRIQIQIMDLGYAILKGEGDYEANLEAIQKLQSQLSPDALADLRWLGEQMVSETTEQLPFMLEAIKASPWGAIPGALVGALISLGVGAAEPTPAFEAATLVPFTLKGAKIGGGIAAANRIRQLEAGGMYLELLDMEDEFGNKIDPAIAKVAAHAVGLINGGIELIQWTVLLSTFGVGTKVFENAAQKATTKLFAAGTIKQIVAKYVAKYGATLTAEVGQEMLQEVNNVVFGELAKEINNQTKGTDIPHITGEEFQSRMAEILEKSIKGFGLLVLPGPVIGGTFEIAKRKPVEKVAKAPDFGLRADGTKKGQGYFGELKLPDGRVATEYSIGVEIKGKETQIPSLVPTLTKEELAHMVDDIIPNNRPVPDAIVQKAVDHANERIAEGKSPFASTVDKITEEAPKVTPIDEVIPAAEELVAKEIEVEAIPEEIDTELTTEEKADITKLEVEVPVFEMKRVKGVGFVIIETATGKEKVVVAKRKAAQAKLAELNEKAKAIVPTGKKPVILTGKTTIEKLIKESIALREGLKKAASAARKAFTAGHAKGIAKAKAHFQELKIRDKARKLLKKRIDKALKIITKPPPKSVDFFYRQAINILQAGIDTKFRQKKTLAQREQMRQFLKRATPEQLRDFPKKLMATLAKKDLRQYTIDELEQIATEIQNLESLGKTKQAARLAIEEAEREKVKQGLVETGSKAPVAPDQPRGIDYSRAGFTEGLKNLYLWTLRIPRILDWLDGRKGTFSGIWHRTFYDSVNQQTDKELVVAEGRHKTGMDKMTELGITANELTEVDDFTSLQTNLTLTKEQQMGIYTALKNKFSLDAIVHGNNISIKVAQAVVSNLDKKFIDLADFIIEEYQTNYERLRAAFIETTDTDLGAEEFYTAMVRLEVNEAVTDEEIVQQLTQRLGLKRGYVEKGMTIERKEIAPEHQKPIDLRLVSVWENQVARQEHFIHFAKLLKEMRKLLADKNVKETIVSKLGKTGQVIINSYVDRVANPNIYRAYSGAGRVSRTLRRNVAMSYLAYNLATILKQIPSMVLFMKDAGPAAMLSAISDFSQNPREIWDLVREKAPQIKNAFIERELAEMQESLRQSKDKKTLDKIDLIVSRVGNTGMKGIRFIDGVVRTIGFYAVYQKNLTQLGDVEAARVALNATLRTQPAAAAKDIAQLYATDEFFNWFTMFTNQLNQIWNITTYDTFAYWNNQKYQDAAMTLMGVAVNALLIWMIVNKRLPEDDEDLVDAASDQVINMVPVINSALMAGKKGWGATAPPPIEAAKAVGRVLSQKDKEKAAKRALELAIVLTGVPVTGTKRAINVLKTGNPLELIGKPGKAKKKPIF